MKYSLGSFKFVPVLTIALSFLASGVVLPRPAYSNPKGDSVPAPSDVAAPPATAKKTASGLASRVLEPGTGKKHPTATDAVNVSYTGWTTDGKSFDSNPGITFPLDRVIAGWTEGVQLMVEGEKRRFWIPENLAYQGRAGAPAGMLVFDVKLIKIVEVPKTPVDVAAAPGDANKCASGLKYKVLRPGTGKVHPKPTSVVTVHYSGWTTNGQCFDNSYESGEPVSFPLNRVIAGWTEGLQLMVEGEKARFWIPQELAYKGQKGAPPGMLVFDVELLEIKD
jgi:peptidylprolyl isomerase